MAKEQQVKTVEFEEVVATASDLSGAPKKQIEESCNAVQQAISALLTKHQPKRDGDSVEVITPFCPIISTRLPEQIVTDASGNKVKRPACCAVNTGVRREFIKAANIDLVDMSLFDETPAKKGKSA